MRTLGSTLRQWRDEYALPLELVTERVNISLQRQGFVGGIESDYLQAIEEDREPQGSSSLRTLEWAYVMRPYSLRLFASGKVMVRA